VASEAPTTTLVDSNVLLDVLTDDPTWADSSSDAVAHALDRGPVVINPIVYAEVSV
jgi:predicted nucleic acid-binding protein